MPGDPHLVFVYGTLTDPERVDDLLDDWTFDGDATLVGCHRLDGRYPTLAPGGRTDGRLLRTPDLAALDAYEGVASGLYVRVAVSLAEDARRAAGRGGEAWLYVGNPARLDAPDEWPGEGPFAERVRRHLRSAGATVRRT